MKAHLLKYLTLFLLVYLISNNSFSQSNTKKTVTQSVLEQVNLLRDSLNLNPLQYNDILCEAGEDHGYYMAQEGELTHF